MRNMGQNTATKSLSAHITAENCHSWKSPFNELQAQYWINVVHHVCHWLCVCWYLPDSSCKMTTLITNIFWIGAMMLLAYYIDNWIKINVSEFWAFCSILRITSLGCTEWFLFSFWKDIYDFKVEILTQLSWSLCWMLYFITLIDINILLDVLLCSI